MLIGTSDWLLLQHFTPLIFFSRIFSSLASDNSSLFYFFYCLSNHCLVSFPASPSWASVLASRVPAAAPLSFLRFPSFVGPSRSPRSTLVVAAPHGALLLYFTCCGVSVWWHPEPQARPDPNQVSSPRKHCSRIEPTSSNTDFFLAVTTCQ